MSKIDIFGDNRKIPKLSINVKIKIDSDSITEINNWNSVFGYIMKKPRTKLEFLSVSSIRNLQLSKITLDSIKNNISEEDFLQLNKIENIFNKKLTTDIKAFILSVLHIPYTTLEAIANS